MSARYPSSGAPRHLLPQGEKELLSSPSPLEGEGGSARSAMTDEGAAGRKLKFAKQLRKDMTDAEKKLWYALRDRRFENFKFRRQVPIGKYIADFVCQDCKLIVEVDGSQHAECPHDRHRDAYFRNSGYSTLRFWTDDVSRQRTSVCDTILSALEGRLACDVKAFDLRYIFATAHAANSNSEEPTP